ncbi:ATP-dependent DNA helicase RecG [Planktothrix sp. FACHB-1365]|uniref:ATP-dependent DNA helicase RecG n=1 Tax=Planktothrix sp. FACHB-1365 TaxID=2692855 RepID=UPI0016855073|nr:ATP-dependent DNA helicase RecG [Planktothrix sp. FACHB-1365]MBD2484009.1 ATP-dependent DNA helicase RecG [Planktothrix sp. FACHB-1365]
MNLHLPLHHLLGLSKINSRLLKKLGINTIFDLLFYFPRDYIKYQRVKISELKIGDSVTVVGKIKKHEIISPPKNPRLTIQTLIVRDKTGNIACKRFFNHPYYQSQQWRNEQNLIYIHQSIIAVSGVVKADCYYGKVLTSPEIRLIDLDEARDTKNSIIPIYPLTKGVSHEIIQDAVSSALEAVQQLIDPLPPNLRQKPGLMELQQAIAFIHQPPNEPQLEAARRRLTFDEFFYLQLSFLLRRHRWLANSAVTEITPTGLLLKQFYSLLPFPLTQAQRRVINEILNDMTSKTPMNRLVQGDVGSGKTVVAVAAILVAIQSGYQTALMAPTEVLAEQHYRKIVTWFEPLGVSVQLLTGSAKVAKRREIHAQLETGELSLLVGTHALLQEKVNFNKLGLVVIDEQHRFGVQQRQDLLNKGNKPHVLTMTATPIPRTLALTLHGDLDVSQIDELPPGRQKIQTKVINQGTPAYNLIRHQVLQGRQAYIILPLVEESDKLDLRAAVAEYQRLSTQIFPEFRVGLLHGRMTSAEKDEALRAFSDNTTQILVSTTVVEVGVDVPNATVILIDHAECFGLAQLHQLRGRVGRGSHCSYCLLLNTSQTAQAKARLQVLEKSSDGFFISEMDLRLRGPGVVMGYRQSGISEFALANILDDEDLLNLAREMAIAIVKSNPNLEQYPLIVAELKRRRLTIWDCTLN